MMNVDLAAIAEKCHGAIPRLEPIWDEFSTNTVYFVNSVFGVKLHQRSESDKHVSVTILMEGFGAWFEGSGPLDFSSYWIPDLKDLLQVVYDYLNTSNVFERDVEGMGYRFK